MVAVTFSNLDSSWFPRISLRSLAKKAKIFAFIAKFRYNLVREKNDAKISRKNTVDLEDSFLLLADSCIWVKVSGRTEILFIKER